MLGRIRVGSVHDVLFGADLGVILGLVVETDAGRQCFLPWAGARIVRGAVLVSSPALLLGEVELEYYLSSGLRLGDVLGVTVDGEHPPGHVRDLTVNADGSIAELVLTRATGRSTSVSVGDVRVHWSAGQAPQLAVGRARGSNRRHAVSAAPAVATGGPLA